jgi:tetratricopeptide (TPR) repeat protein
VILGIACACVVLVLGALQVTAALALRAQAAPASLVHVAPQFATRAVDSLEPHAYEPEELRRVLAAGALARGDVARASRFAQTLRPGADRSALEGAIAQARGDDAGAIADYLAAGDLARLEDFTAAIAAHGDYTHALRLQAQTIATLQRTGAQNDTIAEAYYRDALLLQANAYARGATTPAGTALEVRSQAAYARAAALAPLEERYLIALGNQDLNLGRLDAARATFTHLRDLDPGSVEGLTGLADAAIRAHDFATAASELDAAARLAPHSPDVAAMRARLHP